MPAWTAEEVEREYSNRDAVPDHARFFERWAKDSEFARATLDARLDLAYGPDPRQRVDLFPAKGSRGLLVFIHGGYWRSFAKESFSWIAPPFVAAGVSVANVGYRLCPQVRIADIVRDVVAAMRWILAHAHEHGAGAERIAVAGHSAGGHLVGALFATPRERLGFDPAPIAGGMPISGIFDFEPIPLYSANAELRLDAAEARSLDLMAVPPSITAPLVVCAGGAETSEFRRQSREYAAARGAQVRDCLILPGYHHFSILDALVERGQPLHRAALELLA